MLSRDFSSDVVVIGAGVIGLSSAIELAGRGCRVTVLERGQAGTESSWAGGGILSPLLPWNYGEAVNALSEFSRNLWPEWSGNLEQVSGVKTELRKTGMLVMPPFDTGLARAWCVDHQWRCEVRPANTVIQAEIANTAVDALWLPDVAQVRNPLLLNALRGTAVAMGVNLVEHAGVQQAVVEGDEVSYVEAACGRFAAAQYVIAAGAWSGGLPGLVAAESRVFPVRGQMLLFKLRPDALPTVILEDGKYLIPRRDGHVLAGSTMEYVGFDKQTTSEAREMLLAFAARYLGQGSELVIAKHWAGLRPGAPGNVPAIGRYAGYRNVFINAGHFRYGVTMAPGAAKLLGNLIFDEPTPIAAHYFEAD